ncbi:transient receptor potential cation channel subfamily M member 6-like [Mytilus galloprovincialis]|uniref:transient receptor potential cation channel subfamily M member 6-like n=1 Tax=Mytilus galloprovincialis TaxID=29158 RepID=UPI003F7CC37B
MEKLSEEYTPSLSKAKDTVLIQMRVPVLMIAVEGDKSTIHQIKEAVERNIPVLLMKGSGKAVDFIIEYLNESRPIDKEKILKINAPLLLGIYMRSDEYMKLQRRMATIQEYSHLITIFDLNNAKNEQMEDFVVKAIIRVWSLKEIQKNPNDRMKKKTVTMNNVKTEGTNGTFMEHIHVMPGSLSLYFYIAYQYIQESGKIIDKDKELQLLLLEAIIADRVDYVSTLIQRGVMFDWKGIRRLFAETLKCKGCDAKDCKRIHAIHFRVSKKCCKGIWCTCSENKDCKKQTCTCTCTCNETKSDANSCSCSSRDVDDILHNVRNICQKLLHYPKDISEKHAKTQCSVVPFCCSVSKETTNENH